MTRVLTIADLLWLLLWCCQALLSVMGRARLNPVSTVLALCFLVLALSVLLTYRCTRCVRISHLRNPYLLENLPEQSLHLYDQMANSRPESMLLRHRPGLTVHYMWCLNSHLEFKHYLSLLSVAKVLKPDQIIFHYLQLPQTDTKGYFTWFEDIQREVATISLKPIHNARHCNHQFSKGVSNSEDFPNNDGVFMMDDVAIASLSREDFYRYTGADRQSSCQHKGKGVCERSERRPAQLFLMPSSEPYHLSGGQGRAVIECPTIDAFNKAPNSTCLQLSQRLFPSDIWLRNKTFDRFARWVAYNHSDPVRPQPLPDLPAPRLMHVLKLDGDPVLSPLCYASLLSAFTQGHMTHVFVHGQLDTGVSNTLWTQLRDRYPVTHIPTPSLDEDADPKKALLYGLQALLQYGGVLLSCDTLVQKPLQPLLEYPAVSTVQKSIYRIVHHHMDLAVMMATPASRYLRTLTPVLQQLVDIQSDRDVGAVAFHLYEQRPASLHLDSNLVAHLTCKNDRCVASPGQLDVRQAYTVKLTWTEGTPPANWQLWTQLSTPVRSLVSLASPVPA